MKKEKQGKYLVHKGEGNEGHFKVKYIWSVKEIFGDENYLILKEKENEGKEKWEIFGEKNYSLGTKKSPFSPEREWE